MSMNSHFVEIRPVLLKRLQQEPSLVATIVFPELSNRGSPSDGDVDAMKRWLTPAQQEYDRAVDSADADAIVAAMKKIWPRKHWQVLEAHFRSKTKEELLKEAAEGRERLAKMARGFKSRSARVARQKAGGRPIPDGDINERICLDKAWGGLHYLLCGVMDTSRESVGLAVLGGTKIGDDHGYGPARYLSASRVKTVAAGLSTITHERLRQCYDGAAMNEARVYPGRWHGGHNCDSLDWLLQAFNELSRFYRGAADRGNAVIKYLL